MVNVQTPDQYQDPPVPGIVNFVLLVLPLTTLFKLEFKQTDCQVIVTTHQKMFHKSKLMILLLIGSQLHLPTVQAMLTPNQL
jgi:hypothetical protein